MISMVRIFRAATFFSLLLMAGWVSAQDSFSIQSVERPSEGTNAYFLNNRAPLQPLAFMKLPIRSIQPKGWLRESLLRAKNGMTGRLDEVSEWLQKENNAWLSPTGEGINGWEEVPYWLKGYGDLAYILNDTAMIAEAKVWINGVLNSQREDGYFGPESSRHNGKPDLWPNMVMLWCLQSYYDYSKDERVLPFMTKYFQWEYQIPDSSFLAEFWGNSRGGDNLYSVYWLYNRTGEAWLLDLAKKIHRNTADWRQHDNLPNWHNVNIAQGFREPAVYFMQTKDEQDLRSTYDNFHYIRQLYGQVPGGMFGADENARTGYNGPQQGVETCGMVEQMNSDEMLIQITGDPFWADHCEDVAFNTYPAALTPDFKALRYFTAPNMVTGDSANHHPGIDNTGPFFMMNPLSNRCCQHNHTQGWPYFSENLWMATPDNGLASILLSASSVTAMVGDGKQITIEEETNYPFSEEIKYTVRAKQKVGFPLYLRVPGWCADASVTLNNKKATQKLAPNSYVRIEREWRDGDQLVLTLPQQLSVTEWENGRNGVSVNYGPLTYSLEIQEEIEKVDPIATALHDSHWIPDVDTQEWPAYSIMPKTPWNYGLLLDKSNPATSFEVVKKGWPKDNYPFTPQSVPIKIVAHGKQIPSWKLDEHKLCGPLPQSPVATDKAKESITLIPMGAARLRVSSFPVVE